MVDITPIYLYDEIHGADLDGTQKQVSWAIDIRKKMIHGLADLKETVSNASIPAENVKAACELIDATVSLLEAKASAKWFIDNRNASSELIIDRIAKEK